MPYEYRSLTTQEQKEIVKQRRERGYPLHSPPHPYRCEGYYLITAANYNHQPVMDAPQRRTDFEYRLLQILQDAEIEIAGWVILPNHYHVLVGVHALEQITVVLRQLHGETARLWNQEDNLTAQRRVWYRYEDRMMRDQNHYYVALNYLHFNPTKHGYVTDPYTWQWSSLNMYAQDHGREWLRSLWKQYPPNQFNELESITQR